MVFIELLVEQYVNNFCGWLEFLGIEVGWFVGKLKGKVCNEVLVCLEVGDI